MDYEDNNTNKEIIKENSTYYEKCSTNYTDDLMNLDQYQGYHFYKHKRTDLVTNIIPNIINKSLQKNINTQLADNKYIKIIEDFLYVLVPLLSIVSIIFLIIHCRKVEIRREIKINLSIMNEEINLSSDNLNDSTESSTIILSSLV